MKTTLHTITRVARQLLLCTLLTTTALVTRANYVVDSVEYESMGSGTVKTIALHHTSPIHELTFPNRVSNKNVIRIEFPYNHTVGKFAPGATLTLPSQLRSIGSYAFTNTTISKINFNSTLKEIEEAAFMNAPVEELDFPASVTSIGQSAFYGCNSVMRITFPANSKLTEIKQLAFSDTQIEELVLPDSCKLIEGNAFQRCSRLRKVVLPVGLKKLGNYLVFMTDVDTLHLYARTPLLAAMWASPQAFAAQKAVVVHIPVGVMSLFQNSSWKAYQLKEDAACGNFHVVSVVNKTPEVGNITLEGATPYKEGMWVVDDNGSVTIKLNTDQENHPWYCLVNGEDWSWKVDDQGMLTIPNVTQDIAVETGFISNTALVPFVIKQANGGSLTFMVYNNEPLKLNIKADEGWSIHSVTLNGKDITRKLDGYGDLTIRKVNGIIVVGGTQVDEAADDEPIDAFVAFDNEESSIQAVDDGTKLKVLGMRGGLRIENLAPGQVATVTDIAGRVMATVTGTGSAITLQLPSNIYLISSNGVTVKIAI